MRSILLALAFLAVATAARPVWAGQVTRVSEATAADAALVQPGPPTGIKATIDRREVVVSWKAIPLDRIVGYDVYRRVGTKAFAKLVQVKEPLFVDKHVPKGLVEYAISAVDVYSNKSPLSKPVAPVANPAR